MYISKRATSIGSRWKEAKLTLRNLVNVNPTVRTSNRTPPAFLLVPCQLVKANSPRLILSVLSSRRVRLSW